MRRYDPCRQRQRRKVQVAVDLATEYILGSNSPRASRAIARCSRARWRRSRPTSPSAPSQRKGGPRHPQVSRSHCRPGRHCGHPDPQEWPCLKRGMALRPSEEQALQATLDFGRALWKRLRATAPEATSKSRCCASRASASPSPSRDPDRQATEIHTRIVRMTRLSSLGQPRSRGRPNGKGQGRLSLRPPSTDTHICGHGVTAASAVWPKMLRSGRVCPVNGGIGGR